MKKTILSAILLTGFAATMYGQQIFIDNTAGGGKVNGLQPSDMINVQLFGGADVGSLQPIVTLRGTQLLNLGGGLIYDSTGASYVVPGVQPNAVAMLHMLFWVGTDNSYAAAAGAGRLVADTLPFSNPTGGGGSPPTIPSGLSGMPNVTVAVIPEPSTLALLALGTGALLFIRRRK